MMACRVGVGDGMDALADTSMTSSLFHSMVSSLLSVPGGFCRAASRHRTVARTDVSSVGDIGIDCRWRSLPAICRQVRRFMLGMDSLPCPCCRSWQRSAFS